MRAALAITFVIVIFTACGHGGSSGSGKDDGGGGFENTIQSKIDNAPDGATIEVEPGTYVENIDFRGKAITLKSTAGPRFTVIDGNGGRVVSFVNGETDTSVLKGFTIRNGSIGIYCAYTKPEISNNIIEENKRIRSGAGIVLVGASPKFVKNIIRCNESTKGNGGGILVIKKSTLSLYNNLVYENTAARKGGGICCDSTSNASVVNSTFYQNTAGNRGGGIYCDGDTNFEVLNSILWGNTAPKGSQLYAPPDKAPEVTYCDVEGGWPGAGNIDKNPLFVDAEGHDFHLKQDPCQIEVVNPCVDAGNDEFKPPLDGSTRTDGGEDVGMVDLGFHHYIEGNPSIKNVVASQRLDATKLVDIYYDLSGDKDYAFFVSLRVVSDSLSIDLRDPHATGALGPGQMQGFQRHVIWNPAVDLPEISGDDFKVKVLVQETISVESGPFIVVAAEKGSLNGTVFDLETGEPLGGAEVTVKDVGSCTTESDGYYIFSKVKAGMAEVHVDGGSYTEYYARDLEVTICEDSTATLNVHLIKKEHSWFKIIEVYGEYFSASKRTYYLAGVNKEEKITATIDWGSHEPGKVIWRMKDSEGNPTGEKVTDSGFSGGIETISQCFVMGSNWWSWWDEDFVEGGTLEVVAVTKNGKKSTPYEANFMVVPTPLGYIGSTFLYVPPSLISEDLVYLCGSMALGESKEIEEGAKGDKIPKNKPFGGKAFEFSSIFDASAEVKGDGSASAEFSIPIASKDNVLKKFKVSGVEASVDVEGGVTWNFHDDLYNWKFEEAFLNLSFGLKAMIPPKGAFYLPPPLSFLYMRGKVEAGLNVGLTFSEWMSTFPASQLNTNLNGTLSPNCYLEYMTGAGIAGFFAVELYFGGGGELILIYPVIPGEDVLDTCRLYVVGGVRLYFLFITKEWPLIKYTWDLFGTGDDGGRWSLEEPKISIIPRNYLYSKSGYAVFVANNPHYGTQRSGGTREQVFELGVFGQSTPHMAALGSDLIKVWIYDDPDRNAVNRTELVYSHYDGGLRKWRTPQAVADDGTADFHPQVADLPNGDALVVWENVKEVLLEPEDPQDEEQVVAKYEEAKAKTEINVARYDAFQGTWSPQKRLTNNKALDHSPRIATALDGTAMLVWVRNKGGDETGSLQDPNIVYYATYDGAAWSAPAQVVNKVPSIIKSAVAYNGLEALVVYAGYPGKDTEQPADRELFAIRYVQGGWGPVLRLTNDNLEDANPQVAFDANGNLLLAWYRNGQIMYATDLYLSDQDVAVDLECTGSTGGADFRLATGLDGRIGLVWQECSEDLVDMWYANYIPNLNPDKPERWTEKRRLTQDEAGREEPSMEYAMAPVYDAQGELVVAFDRAKIEYETKTIKVNGQPVVIKNIPATGQVDLVDLWHDATGDLGVFTEDISLSPENPLPGQNTVITALIKNLGDLAVQDFQVCFYDEASLIEACPVGDIIEGGGQIEVTAEWEVPAMTYPHALSVFVDPEENIDTDLSNNTAIVPSVLKPDAAVPSIQVHKASAWKYLITARVFNEGSIDLNNLDVSLRLNGPKGKHLDTQSITKAIPPGAFQDLTFAWQSPPVKMANTLNVYVVADELDLVDEFDENNNSCTANLINLPPSAEGSSQINEPNK